MLKKYVEGQVPPLDAVFYFSAHWCVPCKMVKPIVDKSPVEVIEIDADKYPTIVLSFRVSSLPTILRTKDGIPVSRISGSHSEQEINDYLEKK